MIDDINKKFHILVEDKTLRMIGVFILVGILIRMVLLPIATSTDLLNASYRETIAAFNHILKTNDLNEVILGYYIGIMKPFLGGLMPALNNPTQAGILDANALFAFSGSTNVFRYLFILKLPFLLADILSLYFILKIFEEPSKKLIATILWAFNPFIIYSVYVWGRYEIFAILCLFIALFWAKKERSLPAFVFLGLSIACRTPFVLFLPFFLIYFSKNWKETIKYSLITLLIPFVVAKSIIFLGGTNIISDLSQYDFFSYFLAARFTGGFDSISINFLIYPLVLYLFYKNRSSFNSFISFGTVGILSVMALSYIHPHYFVWVTPFLLLAAVSNKKIILPIIILAVTFYQLCEIAFGEDVSFSLFLPINRDIFSSAGSLFHSFPILQADFSIILDSLLVLSVLIISFLLFKNYGHEDKS